MLLLVVAGYENRFLGAPTMTEQSCTNDVTSALRGLDRFVKSEMAKWEVPGVAIGIVKGKRCIYTRAFGVRDAKRDLEVTPETLFSIASTTKAFTATAAGILVDEKKLDLDKPVREIVPSFKLKDKVATERVTMRDLLCHRTGLPRHDLVWWKSAISRAEIFQRLRYLPPTTDLRQTFQYCNLAYIAAGVIIEQISGQSWEDFVRERILAPLDMAAAEFFTPAMYRTANIAIGHRKPKTGDRFRPMPPNQCPAVGPAGTLCANVGDMCKWLIMNLNGGKYRGREVVSEKMLADIHAPQMVLPGVPEEAEFLPSSYALGWAVSAYRGHLSIAHGGSINNTLTQVALFPRDRLGLVLSINGAAAQSGNLLTTVAHRVCDRLFGLRSIPWSKRLESQWEKQQAELRKTKKKRRDERVKQQEKEDPRPARPVADYVGCYENPAYGRLTLSSDGGKLRGDLHGWRFTLLHCHGNSFQFYASRASGQPPAIRFHTNRAGDISSMGIKLSGATISFGRAGS